MTGNGSSPATKADLQAGLQGLRAESKSDLQAGLQGLRAESKSDIQAGLQGLRAELKSDIQGLRTELKSDIQKVAVEVTKTNLRMDRMEDRVIKEMRAIKADLLQAYEATAVQGKAYSDKALTHGSILAAHDNTLAAHESSLREHGKRLKSLETRR